MSILRFGNTNTVFQVIKTWLKYISVVILVASFVISGSVFASSIAFAADFPIDNNSINTAKLNSKPNSKLSLTRPNNTIAGFRVYSLNEYRDNATAHAVSVSDRHVDRLDGRARVFKRLLAAEATSPKSNQLNPLFLWETNLADGSSIEAYLQTHRIQERRATALLTMCGVFVAESSELNGGPIGSQFTSFYLDGFDGVFYQANCRWWSDCGDRLKVTQILYIDSQGTKQWVEWHQVSNSTFINYRPIHYQAAEGVLLPLINEYSDYRMLDDETFLQAALVKFAERAKQDSLKNSNAPANTHYPAKALMTLYEESSAWHFKQQLQGSKGLVDSAEFWAKLLAHKQVGPHWRALFQTSVESQQNFAKGLMLDQQKRSQLNEPITQQEQNSVDFYYIEADNKGWVYSKVYDPKAMEYLPLPAKTMVVEPSG